MTRSYTARLMQKTRKSTQKEQVALPFFPLVLHPTLSSFPSWIHNVNEEGIHSWEQKRRRRRRTSKRVRKRRREGGQEGGASKQREDQQKRERGGVQLFQVDERCIQFRTLLLLLQTERKIDWSYLKQRRRICYRGGVLYNLSLSLWFPPVFSDVYSVLCESDLLHHSRNVLESAEHPTLWEAQVGEIWPDKKTTLSLPVFLAQNRHAQLFMSTIDRKTPNFTFFILLSMSFKGYSPFIRKWLFF